MFVWAVKVLIHGPLSEKSDQAMMLILWYSLIFLLHMHFIATVVAFLWTMMVIQAKVKASCTAAVCC